MIQSKLGVGKIYSSRTDMVELQVNSFKDMAAVINFFDKYPLITQKWAGYLLFRKAYELMLNKEHRAPCEGVILQWFSLESYYIVTNI